MAVLVLYWVWFAYLKYGKGESEASKEVMLASVLARQSHSISLYIIGV